MKHSYSTNNALEVLQKQYKRKTNVFRLVKSWKFNEKGCINIDDFKNKVQKIMLNKLN